MTAAGGAADISTGAGSAAPPGALAVVGRGSAGAILLRVTVVSRAGWDGIAAGEGAATGVSRWVSTGASTGALGATGRNSVIGDAVRSGSRTATLRSAICVANRFAALW